MNGASRRESTWGSRGRRLAAAAAITAALALAAAAAAGAHWESATPVDNGGAGATSLETGLAASPDGLATGIFFQAASGGPQPGPPYAIRRAAGASAWSAPAPVATPAGSPDTFSRVALAAAGDGDALGLFHFRDSTPKRVIDATSWPAGAAGPGAAAPVFCVTGAECAPEPPQVAIDADGNGYATATAGFNSIMLARRDAGTGTWSTPEPVGSGNEPRLAVNASGDVVVAYSRLDTSNPALQVRRIYAKRRLAGQSSFEPEVQISGPNAVELAGHAAVIDDSGNATILFPEDTLPPTGGAPGAPVIMAAHWSPTDSFPDSTQAISNQADGQARPVVGAVDPQGRVTAVWTSFAGHASIFAAEQTGAGWSAPQHVSPADSNRTSSGPRVAVDPAGTATVVYLDNASPQGGDIDVKVSRRPTGGSWSAPESLRAMGSGAGPVGGGPRVAAGRPGQADVTFVQQLNGTNRLFATRFEHGGYSRPVSASPVRVSLVPAFAECTAPNRTHGPPLEAGSCNPPAQRSGTLTVGTFDANGAAANSVGSAQFRVLVGDPATTADEADVQLSLSITDVRNRNDLSDYTGELEAMTTARITDRDGDEPSTIRDVDFGGTVPCVATPTGVGSTCSIDTSFDALVPGVVVERNRALWQLGQIQVRDGGADGDAGTEPNSVFAVQGVFIP